MTLSSENNWKRTPKKMSVFVAGSCLALALALAFEGSFFFKCFTSSPVRGSTKLCAFCVQPPGIKNEQEDGHKI